MGNDGLPPIGEAPREPPRIDTSVAHIARMQNYWRGGTDYFPADREAAEQAMAAYPDIVHSVRANRDFQARAVRYLVAEAGIRQFLDVGAGLPAAGSVHEVAARLTPGCRVVYVDNDPVVLAHAQAVMSGAPPGAAHVVGADLRDLVDLVEQVKRLLDFSEPVAVMLVSVLHMISDAEQPWTLVRELMGAVPPGSCLTLTHVAADIEPQAMAEMTRRVNRRVARPVTHRDRAAVSRFFDGLEIVPPGVVRVPEWRPQTAELAAGPSAQWGGVARRPSERAASTAGVSRRAD